MARLNPYLNFSGNCREAMSFYKECLGGDLTFMVVGESPVAGQVPPEFKDQILHSLLKLEDFEIMGSDMTPETIVNGNANHLCLICSSEKELYSYWEKLSQGGKINQPLHQMFFGVLGTFTDKFGKRWLLEFDNQPTQ